MFFDNNCNIIIIVH